MTKRNQPGLLSVEGRNPVLEALRAKMPTERIFLDSQLRPDEKIAEIQKLARTLGVSLERVSRRFLDRRSQTGVHQGVIALVNLPPMPTLKQIFNQLEAVKRYPFLLILTGVLYEQNLGAVIRTAESAGVDAVVLPNRSSGITPVVARTSVGACFWIPLIQVNLFGTLNELVDWGVTVIGADLSGKSLPWSIDLTGPTALVVGGEDQGLSPAVRKYCHYFVRIPMFGKVSSLNLSVASAILLYERVRQINQKA